MHPGANVGMDLFLWMAFAITAVFAMFAAIVGFFLLLRRHHWLISMSKDTLYLANRSYSSSSRNGSNGRYQTYSRNLVSAPYPYLISIAAG